MNAILRLIIALLIWSMLSVAYSQPPVGTWNVDATGHAATLIVYSVDATGRLNATYNNQKVYGFWNEDMKEISFLEIVNPKNKDAVQIYTGYYWRTKNTENMAGWFKSFSAAGGTAQRSLYGWSAEKRVG